MKRITLLLMAALGLVSAASAQKTTVAPSVQKGCHILARSGVICLNNASSDVAGERSTHRNEFAVRARQADKAAGAERNL